MNGKRKRNKGIGRAVTAAAALLLVLPCLLLAASSAYYSPAADIEDVELTDGVYRIRNYASDLYLDAYTSASRSAGKAYLSASAPSDSGQCIRLEGAGKDTFRLYPQNENGNYCFSWSSGTQAGSLIAKTHDASDGCTLFDIIKLSNGAFTIAPSAGDNPLAVLSLIDMLTEYRDTYAGISNYSSGVTEQMWIFEPVQTERITTTFSYTRLKVFSTGRFYARKYPYNVSGTDLVWTCDNDEVLMVGENGSYCALAAGTAVVTASDGARSVSFTVDVTDSPCFTWYSQNNIYTSNWDGTELKDLFFASGAYKMRFASDTFDEPRYSSWIDTGCALCSVASVLHNMDARMTSGVDLRSGQNGGLPVDPYIVALANSGNMGVESASQVMYGSPVYMNWDYLARRFNADGEQIAVRKIYNPSRRLIQQMLVTHPQGVVILLSTPSRTHYVVFAECLNPEEPNQALLEFKIYDPAAYYAAQGDGVPFNETTSYVYSGYRYSSITTMIIYDKESNINK